MSTLLPTFQPQSRLLTRLRLLEAIIITFVPLYFHLARVECECEYECNCCNRKSLATATATAMADATALETGVSSDVDFDFVSLFKNVCVRALVCVRVHVLVCCMKSCNFFQSLGWWKLFTVACWQKGKVGQAQHGCHTIATSTAVVLVAQRALWHLLDNCQAGQIVNFVCRLPFLFLFFFFFFFY